MHLFIFFCYSTHHTENVMLKVFFMFCFISFFLFCHGAAMALQSFIDEMINEFSKYL